MNSNKIIVPNKLNFYDLGSMYWSVAMAALQTNSLINQNGPDSDENEHPALLVIETETLSETEKTGHLNGHYSARPLSDYDRLKIEVEIFINIPDMHVTDAMIRENLHDRPGAEYLHEIIAEVRNEK